MDLDFSSITPSPLSSPVGGLPVLLTEAEAAKALGISVRRLQAICRDGKIEYVRIAARERRFTAEQIRDFIERKTVTVPKRIPVDRKASNPLPSHQSVSDSRNYGDSAKSLREEMRLWR